MSPAFYVNEGDGPTAYYHRDQLARIIGRISAGAGDEFLIVQNDPDSDGYTYCQAYFDEDGWQVEYQAGSLDDHYGQVTTDDDRVFELFCQWLDDDPAFLTCHWEKLNFDGDELAD